MELEEILIFIMTMEVSTRCMHQESRINLVDFSQVLIINNFSPRKNILIFTPNQFNIHKMEREEILTSKLQMVDSSTQTSNIENTDKHLKHPLEAIIKFHSTLKSAIWARLKCKDQEGTVWLRTLFQELKIS